MPSEEEEKDYTTYLTKEPSTLHREFAAWICEKTGYDPKTAKTKEQVFLDAIRLGATLRMAHQASPENQASIVARRAAAAAAAEEKAVAKAAEKPAPKVDPDFVKPARRPVKAAKATAEPKVEAEVKPAARRRPAAKASAGTASAPF